MRAQVARIVGRGDEVTTGQIPFTPRAKKTLELALREALSLGHNYIGTEHLMLALARENGGVAMCILWDFGVGNENLRDAVSSALSGEPFTPELRNRRGTKPEARSARDFSHVRHALSVAGPRRDWLPTLVAGVFLAVGLAVGLLLGWLIWG